MAANQIINFIKSIILFLFRDYFIQFKRFFLEIKLCYHLIVFIRQEIF